MISYTTEHFWKSYQQLDVRLKKRAQKAFRLFETDPHHPSLEFKKIHSNKPIYSARVTLNCRAVGIRDKNEIVWVWIGTHDKYEQFINNI